MKRIFFLILLSTAIIAGCSKNKKDDSPAPFAYTPTGITGAQSPMGNVGETANSSSSAIAGVSNFEAAVTGLNNGISTYTGSAIITNQAIKDLLADFPEIIVNGDTAKTTTMKFKNTAEGIESCSGPGAGILVKYSSNIGDTYPINGTTKVRTVVRKDVNDDYYWGGMYIKAMKVEEDRTGMKSLGVSKIAYYANHKWGLVGFEITFDDQTVVSFPVFSSTSN
ncbi:MAG: hypothetical protein WCK02_00695 [Bacteroidota bacterium]